MREAPCDGCGVVVSIYDLSQKDSQDAPKLCLVCAYPEFYCYPSVQERLPL